MLGTPKVTNLDDAIVTEEVGGFDITVTDGVSVEVPEAAVETPGVRRRHLVRQWLPLPLQDRVQCDREVLHEECQGMVSAPRH